MQQKAWTYETSGCHRTGRREGIGGFEAVVLCVCEKGRKIAQALFAHTGEVWERVQRIVLVLEKTFGNPTHHHRLQIGVEEFCGENPFQKRR